MLKNSRTQRASGRHTSVEKPFASTHAMRLHSGFPTSQQMLERGQQTWSTKTSQRAHCKHETIQLGHRYVQHPKNSCM